MARIILGSYVFRYPLGGMISWAMQYLNGLIELGHDVYFVEKYGYDNSCYNPVTKEMSDDCSYGIEVVSNVMNRFGMKDRWCFVSKGENYFGIQKNRIEEIFSTADLFIDMGSHGSWNDEAQKCQMRVLIDGEPAFTQIKWSNKIDAGSPVPTYDRYYSNGQNIGKTGNPAPSLGLNWGHLYSPISCSSVKVNSPPSGAPYSTVMNWKSHAMIEYKGKQFGQKDIEFARFIDLPQKVGVPMEVAVSGEDIPENLLRENKWRLADAQAVTISYHSFNEYIQNCRGEFSVCKNIFVQNKTGWFSDKSAAFLASGRPVILQDTGFSEYLPTGDGLFAVENSAEAAEAIEEIESDYEYHSSQAREIAIEYLDAKKVMGKFLEELNL
jgi:hypothetical protein